MRRFVSWSHSAVALGCLLSFGAGPAARAEIVTSPFERFVASWMGIVGVIGAADEPGAADELEVEIADDDRAYEIADDDSGERPHRGEHRHRDRERGEGGRRCRHGCHGRHGDHGPPEHRFHHHAHGDRPHHRRHHHDGMGPGRMGPPAGPDMHHMAMRGLHEIIRRLARIEEKLGIEDAPPSGARGEHRRRDIPEDVRRNMEARMQEGRRRMEEAKGRMEEARKRFQAMEERIKQLEAEVERLKAAK
jgi:hypothetical protein